MKEDKKYLKSKRMELGFEARSWAHDFLHKHVRKALQSSQGSSFLELQPHYWDRAQLGQGRRCPGPFVAGAREDRTSEVPRRGLPTAAGEHGCLYSPRA